MFHRVKSEVQESEQRIQQRQKVDLDYRQDDERLSASREAREQAQETREDQQQKLQARPYMQQHLDVKEQEEVRPMTRQQEDKEVQGKYARDNQDQTIRARSADVSVAVTPSVPAYQRPAAPAPQISRPSAFSQPAYTPTYSAATNSAADTSYSAGDRTLTIGRGINMSGEIEACEHLVVEGTVEAALKGAKVLDVAETGTFYGTVEIEEATVAGRFEGDLTVNGRLTIRSSGVITGSVAYRELEVEAGAMIDGRMTPLKGTVDPKSADKYRAGSEASAMAKAKEILSKKDSREPANTESALFSKAHASY